MSTAAEGRRPAARFRAATTDDLSRLLVLGRRYCEADHHEFDEERARRGFAGLIADSGPGIVVVAEAGREIVGYAVLTRGWSIESGGVDALLDEIYVEVRDRGIGSALLAHLVEEARSWGASRIFLETEADNSRARSLYLRHGFTVEDSVWMSLDL